MVAKPVTCKEPIIEGASVTGHIPKGVWRAKALTLRGGLFAF